jgi:hypothetical protein
MYRKRKGKKGGWKKDNKGSRGRRQCVVVG